MFRPRKVAVSSAAVIGAGVLALIPLVASAHAVINAGQYRVAIGWNFEPPGGADTYVGEPNAVQVFIDMPTSSNPIGTPVGDLNGDCTKPDFQVTVSYAGQTSSPLCPMPTFDPDTGLGRMDEYDAVLTPTRVGDYTFRIYGSIHGAAIDKSVTSGSSTFDPVSDQNSVEFPKPLPAVGDVAAKVDQVNSRASAAASAANSAADNANRAAILSIVAIVVAVVLGGANLAFAIRRRT